MPKVKPFQAIRPHADFVKDIAALPYDVYNRKEAKEVVEKNPLSFLKIDRGETLFPDDYDMYSQEVYDKSRDTLAEMIADGSFVRDTDKCYYVYALTMDGRTQSGLVGCASIDDYVNNKIKKHENTRPDKELDRTRHIDVLSAQTGPIFLAYRAVPEIDEIVAKAKTTPALYDFVAEDGVQHQVWCIKDADTVARIEVLFDEMDSIYIADGHHRNASAVSVGLKRRNDYPNYTGAEEFNFYLSVLFPADELAIYDYNRYVIDLNGHSTQELLNLIGKSFTVGAPISEAYHPKQKGEFGMYLDGNWYPLTVNPDLVPNDPVDGLDASVLQNLVLDPLLNIKDPKTDTRIQFVGGIRGLDWLKKLVDETGGVSFAMYPTTMDELFDVADAQQLMPPKSTWFEPKLRSGLFIHEIER